MLETSVKRVYIPSQLVEAGFEHYDYSPEDLALFDQIAAEQKQLMNSKRVLNPETGDYFPEWINNWKAFEAVRNKYHGMSPKQRNPPKPPVQ